MAVNPMQRKANNSFLLGVLITLLITGAIIAFLFLQVSKLNKEKQAIEAAKTYAYVLTQPVRSGEIIEWSNFKRIEVSKDAIPADAVTSQAELENSALCDSEGREIIQQVDETTGATKYILIISADQRPELKFDEATNSYYYERQANGTVQKVPVKLDHTTVIAKINMEAKTLVTSSMLTKGELLTADIRKQEYNVIELPTQIETGEFVDIRLRLPTGQDYIVVSHKEVEMPQINGINSEKCVWLNLNEVEIINMSAAIVEAFKMNGSRLYATRYVEAGSQNASTTYIPSDDIIRLIEKDPNALTEAKNALFARVQSDKNLIRNPINNAVNNEDAEDNIKEKVEAEIQGLQDEREKYLESLGM